MHNTEPQQWREGIDPFSLPLRQLQLQEVLGYPHAANQVFQIRALRDGREGYYYLKYAHHADANFRNELEILTRLHCPLAPVVVEYDAQQYQYTVTEQILGRRLSMILADTGSEDSTAYLYEYGQTLARLHQTPGEFPEAPHRAFHDIPTPEYCRDRGRNLESVRDWLLANQPAAQNRCFVHGDCHYANILWRDEHIAGILDFELAGMGNREFDIAWSLILRPGQKFLKTEAERQEFLAGYRSVGQYDEALLPYYMVLIYTRFLKAGDAEYEQYIRDWIHRVITTPKEDRP